MYVCMYMCTCIYWSCMLTIYTVKSVYIKLTTTRSENT